MKRKRKSTEAKSAVKKFSALYSKDVMAKTKEKAREEKKKANTGGSTTVNLPNDIEFFRPKKEGSLVIDIIPFIDENGEPVIRVPFAIHRNIGVDDIMVVCPKKTLGMGHRCPICEEHARLKKERGWDDDTVKALRPSSRELYNILDHSDGELKVWDVSTFVFGDKLDEEWAENDDVLVGYVGENGHSIRVRFKEKPMPSGSFLDVSKVDFVEREDPISEEVLERAVNLREALVIYDYDKLSAIFFEEVSPDELEGEEPEEEGEEGEEGEEKEEEEEEEEKPKPAHRTKKAKQTCPAGGTFGEDFEELEECDGCEVWDECADAAE